MATRKAKPVSKKISTKKVIDAPVRDTVQESYTPEKKPSVRMKRSYMLGVLGIIILLGLLYLLRGWFVVAIVNGQPISRMSVIRDLEKQSGKQILNSHITRALIFQEARKQNITISDDEVNTEMKKYDENFKKQGQSLDQVLTLQGMTRKDLEDQIKIQKMIEKMLGKDVKIADKEIDDYIEKNKESLPENAKPEELRANVKQQLFQQKLNEKVRVWIEDLQKKAQIMYFVQY